MAIPNKIERIRKGVVSIFCLDRGIWHYDFTPTIDMAFHKISRPNVLSRKIRAN